MTRDLNAIAAALVVAVNDGHTDTAAASIRGLARDDLRKLVVRLAGHVDPDRPFIIPDPTSGPQHTEKAVHACVIHAATRWGLTPGEIVSTSRRREFIDARHVAAAAARFCGASFPQIGHVLRRDHTTAMNAVTRVGEDARLRRIALDIAKTVGRTPVLEDEVA